MDANSTKYDEYERMKRMKRFKGFVFVLLIALLTFGSAGQLFAAPVTKTVIKEDGRVQIVLEFNDLKEAEWAIQYISKMQSKKIFTGYTDGTFQPNKPVTRAEAIVTAVRLLGLESEAKARPTNTSLNFKDAKHIDKQFGWAKGYIQVALEQGLFDASEDMLQPEKPATRVWVSTLLVRALGLQKEALQQMNQLPNFTDAKQIPATSVGYVNVAVKQGLVTGYQNGSFQPNKPVTRAEMAALLDRTNDGLLEYTGAYRESGTITEIVFNTDVTNQETVTSNVYQQENGKITILTGDNRVQSYQISSELLVTYQGSYIKADQLKVSDHVQLIVKDQKVVEAKIVDLTQVKVQPTNPTNNLGIKEFKLEIELGEKAEVEISYKNKGIAEAKVEIESKAETLKLKGTEAENFITLLLNDVGLTENMKSDELMNSILAALNIKKELVKELELKVKFTNGKEVKVEIEHETEDNHK